MKREVITIIQRIPYGMVSSYGSVATELNKRFQFHSSGWLIGRLLSQIQNSHNSRMEEFCPWWRVVSKHGIISTLKLGQRGIDQMHYLQGEGIVLTDGKIDMTRYEYNFMS